MCSSGNNKLDRDYPMLPTMETVRTRFTKNCRQNVDDTKQEMPRTVA